MQSFVQNLKSLKFGSKLSYLGVLGSNFKILMSYLKSVLLNLSGCKALCKTKKPEIWDQKYPIWVFRQDFEENYCIFEISTLEFFSQNSRKIKKS